MKKLLLAALLGVQGLLAATASAQVCDRGTVVKEEVKITLTGKLVRKVYLTFGPEGDFGPPVAVVVWELHSGDKVCRLDIPEALLAKARKLDGKLVNVSGEMTLNRLQVEKLDEVVAFLPLGPGGLTLPQIERDLRGPDQPVKPALVQTDLFGSIFEGPGGLTLTTDDGKVFKVLVLCGHDDALIKKARRLQTWRFGVQARGVVVGDTLILSDIWPSDPRGPK
jgi:hypothetical protein